MEIAEPFIKWVGGKRQLLPKIKQNIPATYNRYFEPFVGGGAVFFALAKAGSYISDVNHELITTYQTIANEKKLPELFNFLNHHKSQNSQEYYIALRDLDRQDDFASLSDVERSARFIYLNKTGFNGVQRVNRKGHNNVPFGKNTIPIREHGNLWDCHYLLKTTEIVEGSYDTMVDKAEADDFVYFDPPYVDTFTSYTKGGFNMDDQQRLRDVIDALHAKGVMVMISNSYCEATIELYKGYRQLEIAAKRSVNSDGTGRGEVSEILVTTYGEDRLHSDCDWLSF